MVWWMWLLIIFAAIVVGSMIGALVYLSWSKIQEWKLKRQLPNKGTDKKLNSEWIKDNKDLLKDAGPAIPLTEMEVKQDDTNKLSKFREFEKIRRLSQQSKSNDSSIDRASSKQRRSNLQDKAIRRTEADELPDVDDEQLE